MATGQRELGYAEWTKETGAWDVVIYDNARSPVDEFLHRLHARRLPPDAIAAIMAAVNVTVAPSRWQRLRLALRRVWR